jgi:outer membrane receptor for ferrienterochelin and colicins
LAVCVGRKKTWRWRNLWRKHLYQTGRINGSYQLPFQEKLMLSFSGNVHFQDSRYGTTSYIANQNWFYNWLGIKNKIMTLSGMPPDTIITMTIRRQLLKLRNNRENLVTGIFYSRRNYIHRKQKLLLGMRYDYNSIHGSILTPELLQMEIERQ